jgi:hypothetical protein
MRWDGMKEEIHEKLTLVKVLFDGRIQPVESR